MEIEPEPEPLTPSALRNQRNHRITDEDEIGHRSLRSKCHGNLSAIQCLRDIESIRRVSSTDERRILVRYVGWGGLPHVFTEDDKEWRSERQQLRDLLTDQEFESARATTLNVLCRHLCDVGL